MQTSFNCEGSGSMIPWFLKFVTYRHAIYLVIVGGFSNFLYFLNSKCRSFRVNHCMTIWTNWD